MPSREKVRDKPFFNSSAANFRLFGLPLGYLFTYIMVLSERVQGVPPISTHVINIPPATGRPPSADRGGRAARGRVARPGLTGRVRTTFDTDCTSPCVRALIVGFQASSIPAINQSVGGLDVAAGHGPPGRARRGPARCFTARSGPLSDRSRTRWYLLRADARYGPPVGA